jgi:transposase-like protein
MSIDTTVVAGNEGARRATEIPAPGHQKEPAPDPEVTVKASRRRFSERYKLGILRRADTCAGPGELGALLRREGLYSSHLTTWRRQRDAGALQGLKAKKRGPKPPVDSPLIKENKRLLRETHILQRKLQRAELIIDIQKKVSEALGIPLEKPEFDDAD